MRSHADVEDAVCRLTDSGLARMPFTAWNANSAWTALCMIGLALVGWFQKACLHGALAKAAPKRLRWQLWHLPALVCTSARRTLGRRDPFALFVLIGMPGVLLFFVSDALIGGPEHSVPALASLFALLGTGSMGFSFFREHGWGTWDRLRIGTRQQAQALIKTRPSSNTAAISSSPPNSPTIDFSSPSDNPISPLSI